MTLFNIAFGHVDLNSFCDNVSPCFLLADNGEMKGSRPYSWQQK